MSSIKGGGGCSDRFRRRLLGGRCRTRRVLWSEASRSHMEPNSSAIKGGNARCISAAAGSSEASGGSASFHVWRTRPCVSAVEVGANRCSACSRRTLGALADPFIELALKDVDPRAASLSVPVVNFKPWAANRRDDVGELGSRGVRAYDPVRRGVGFKTDPRIGCRSSKARWRRLPCRSPRAVSARTREVSSLCPSVV
jgi:hypothetical protein